MTQVLRFRYLSPSLMIVISLSVHLFQFSLSLFLIRTPCVLKRYPKRTCSVCQQHAVRFISPLSIFNWIVPGRVIGLNLKFITKRIVKSYWKSFQYDFMWWSPPVLWFSRINDNVFIDTGWNAKKQTKLKPKRKNKHTKEISN